MNTKKCRDVMTENLVFCTPGDTVSKVAQLMKREDIGPVLIVDNERSKTLVGIVTDRDLAIKVVGEGRDPQNTKVEEVMTTDLPIVDTADTVEHCMNLMISHKARYLLAYNDQQFVGVITIHDLLRQVLSNKEAVFDHSMAEQLLSHEEGRVY